MNKLVGALVVLVAVHATAQDGAPTSAPVAAPFGIEVGKTTCTEAAPILGGEVEATSGGFVKVSSRGPGYHLAGATELDAVCRSASEPVHALTVTVEPTGASSVSYMQTLRTLRLKYTETRKPRAPDDGMWEFATGNGKALLFNYRGKSVYHLHYLSTSWVEFLKESDEKRRAEQQRKNEERDAAKQTQLDKL